MYGSFFNPAQSFKDIMQSMFDFGKSFNFSNMTPDLNLNKFWDLNKKCLGSTSHINKALNDDITAIAAKQAELIKENAESLTNTMQEMSQSQMTPQKMLEAGASFCQEAAARNMKSVKNLGEMYTKANMKFFESCSDQMKKNLSEYCGPNSSGSCSSGAESCGS
jgi:hypothetical protein